MPSEEQHIASANRTQKTIEHLLLDVSTHSPWIATAAFYKALHIVEAVLAKELGHHSCDHGLPPAGVFDAWLSPQKVVSELLKHSLKQIESSAVKMLSKPNELVLIDHAFPPAGHVP